MYSLLTSKQIDVCNTVFLSTLGVVHHHMGCTVCGVESIAGCLWRCLHCLRYYLCTPCYMQNRHSVWHHFMRIDSPDNPNQRSASFV